MPDDANILLLEDYTAPRTREELKEHLWERFGLRFPTVAQCPGHTAPFDALAEAFFAEAPITIWIASRGFGGKTQMMSALSTMELCAGYSVVLAGGSGEQSRRAHEVTERMWSNVKAPFYLVAREPRRTWTRTIMGNTMQAITASSKAARGLHPQRLRLDEAEECDIKLVDAMLGQTMSDDMKKPAQTAIVSTHHIRSGTMDELLKRAKLNGWPVRRWCYRDTLLDPNNPGSWLLPSERDRKKTEVSSRMWRIEYDLESPSDEEATVFATEDIIKVFGAPGPTLADPLNQYLEIEAPDPEGKYVTSADWGRKTDLSVIATLRIDVQPARLVAWARFFRIAWPKVISHYNKRVARYKNKMQGSSTGIHDATGIGDVIAAYIDIEDAQDFIITSANKARMFLQFEKAVNKTMIVLPRLASLMEILPDLKSVELYGEEHPPDEIVALALGTEIIMHPPVVARVYRVRHM
jgi:hypothetical protein